MEVMSYKETRRKHWGNQALITCSTAEFRCIVKQKNKVQEQRANANLCSSLTVVNNFVETDAVFK